MASEPTTQDVLCAINDFASAMQGEFNGINNEINGMKKQLAQHDQRFSDITTTLDFLVTTTTRTRDDLHAAIEWLKRHEQRLDRHEVDIHYLKSAAS